MIVQVAFFPNVRNNERKHATSCGLFRDALPFFGCSKRHKLKFSELVTDPTNHAVSSFQATHHIPVSGDIFSR